MLLEEVVEVFFAEVEVFFFAVPLSSLAAPFLVASFFEVLEEVVLVDVSFLVSQEARKATPTKATTEVRSDVFIGFCGNGSQSARRTKGEQAFIARCG